MENLGKNYCPVTPEEKENIIKKLAPSARERVKEIYRCLPTADLSAKSEEIYFLRKALSPFKKRSDKEMQYTSYHAGTMTAARLRCIGVRLNTRIKAIRLYPAEIMDTAARLRYIDASLKAAGYTGIKALNRT